MENGKTMTKAQQVTKEIIEDASARLLKGVFSKNVLLHIEGLGVPNKIAVKLLELAERRANELSHYKIGEYAKEIRYKK